MELFGSRDRLVSVLAHDLLNPLGAILAYSELLLGGELTEMQRRQVEGIQRAGLRSQSMLQNLNDLSKLKNGRIEFESGAHEVHALLASLRAETDEAALKREARLVINAPEDLPAVLGDRQRLLQALSILTTNAIQHGPAKGTVTISVRALEADQLEFEIVDCGPGFSAEALDLAIARPIRGLSLIMAHVIIERLGGELVIEARPQASGAVVRITLFAERKRVVPPPSRAATSQPETTGPLL